MRSWGPSLTAGEVRDRIISSADRIWADSAEPAYADREAYWTCFGTVDYTDSAWHPWYGYGRVNAYRALGGLLDSLPSDTLRDTVWMSEALVPQGSTLVISAGTVVRMSRFDLRARGVSDTLAELVVEGVLDVQGSSSNHVRFEPAAEANKPSWYGIRVAAGGTLRMSYCDIANATVALTLDSGAVFDSLPGCSFSDCLNGIALQSGVLELRDVAMTGITDYGIYAAEGNPQIVLDSPVVVQGTPNASVGVSIGPGARLTASYASVEDGYIGFEVEGDRVDNISHCAVTGQTFVGVYFRGSDSVDQSSYNVISKDTAGSLDYGMLVMHQSIASNHDSIAGGFSRNVRFLSSGNSASIDSLRVVGIPGNGYGVFLDGGSGADSVFLYNPEVDGFFNTAHVYIYDIHAELEDGSVVTDTSSAAVSPYGIYDRWNTTGRVRCTDILNQSVACAYRYDSSCSLQWGAQDISKTGYNFIYTPIDSAMLFRNDPGDSVDGRRNYWGASPPDTSRIDVGVYLLPYMNQEQCGGPIVHEEKTAADGESESVLPLRFALEQNVPNPFNPTTEIRFALPRDQAVTVTIYNVLGRMVRTLDLGDVPAGYRSVTWDGKTGGGKAAGSGIYFYRLTTPEFQEVKKMLLLK
jgi:hypothetical protein